VQVVEGWAVVAWSGGGGHDVGDGGHGVWYVVMEAWCGVRWSWLQCVVVVVKVLMVVAAYSGDGDVVVTTLVVVVAACGMW